MGAETESPESIDQPFFLDKLKVFLSRRLESDIGSISVARRDVSSYSALRSFWRADVESGGRRRALHVKCQPQTAKRGALIDKLLHQNLAAEPRPLPLYWGNFRSEGHLIKIWDHCEGVVRKSFDHYSDEEVGAVVDAVVAIESCPASAFEAAGVRGMRWIEPVAEALGRRSDEIASAGLSAELRLWGSIEGRLIDQLNALDQQVLCHNDLKPANVILTRDGGAQIVDWDSLSLGPYGASLRAFSRARRGGDRACAARYVAAHRERGVVLDVDAIRLVMHAREALWALNTGVSKPTIARVASGLRHIGRAFSDDTTLK